MAQPGFRSFLGFRGWLTAAGVAVPVPTPVPSEGGGRRGARRRPIGSLPQSCTATVRLCLSRRNLWVAAAVSVEEPAPELVAEPSPQPIVARAVLTLSRPGLSVQTVVRARPNPRREEEELVLLLARRHRPTINQ